MNKLFKKYRLLILSKICHGKKREHYKNKLKELIRERISDFDMEKFSVYASTYLYACSLHKDIFSEYKNIYNGRNVSIIATGPTLKYAAFCNDGVKIGVNAAFLYEGTSLDYLFAIDYLAIKNYIEKVTELENITKFYGYFTLESPFTGMMIPESVAIRHDAKRFVAAPIWTKNRERHFGYHPDISRFPLHGSASCTPCAVQFALYTNPKRLYLYGCDTSPSGHFYEKKEMKKNIYDSLYQEWRIIKEISQIFYPETEIISVNPVGLKGLFRDVYTEAFLEAHPEIDRDSVELYSRLGE